MSDYLDDPEKLAVVLAKMGATREESTLLWLHYIAKALYQIHGSLLVIATKPR